jgi:hypothetical protein
MLSKLSLNGSRREMDKYAKVILRTEFMVIRGLAFGRKR